MDQYVIYERPADHPDSFVVRRWHITAETIATGDMATGDLWLAATLRGARMAVPEGLVCITRSPDDDPVIVEVWI